MLEYQNIKTFLQNFTFQIGLEKFFWLKMLTILFHVKDEEIFGAFYEKELQKTKEEEFRIEKVIKRKGYKLSVK